MSDVTLILQKIEAGDRLAAKDLLPLVYEELRNLAGSRMMAERADHTLQPTALVHEAYLKLVDGQSPRWDSRGHFFSAAAEAMRRILIDSARAKKSLKRDSQSSEPRPGKKDSFLNDPERLLELDEALTRLEAKDSQVAKLVRLRLFGGLNFPEVALAMNIPKSTAHSWWKYALDWFQVELQQH